MDRDEMVQQTREGVRESWTGFERLCELDAGEVIDSLNAMHDDDVRHIVFSLVLKARNAAVAEGLD